MNWDDLGFFGGLWLDASSGERRAELVSMAISLALAPTCARDRCPADSATTCGLAHKSSFSKK